MAESGAGFPGNPAGEGQADIEEVLEDSKRRPAELPSGVSAVKTQADLLLAAARLSEQDARLALVPAAEQSYLFEGMDPAALATVPDLAQARRGPGRPKGARNRRSEAWARITETLPNPVLGCARLAALSVEALAQRLQCSLLEAARVQLQAAAIAAPYMAARRAQIDLDVEQRQTASVYLVTPPETAPRGMSPVTIDGDAEIIGFEPVARAPSPKIDESEKDQ